MERQDQSQIDRKQQAIRTREATNGDEATVELVAEIYGEGHAYLDAGDLISSQKLFQKAFDANPSHAQAKSYLGLCIAMNERKFEQAVALCTSAAKQEFFNPDLYLNLAMVHLVFGFKTEGRRYLLRGQMIDPANTGIQVALNGLGDRCEPVLRFLPRRHIINRWLGSARYLLSVRVRPQVAA
jgi:Flp pilus assembly protein TadD